MTSGEIAKKQPEERSVACDSDPNAYVTAAISRGGLRAATKDQLTAALAERVMGWTVGRDRFMMGNRNWMPRWRFQPTERLEDAFRLLEEAAPQEYKISGDDQGNVYVQVRIANTPGEARGISKPLAITYAIARAVGVEVGQ